MRIPLYGAPNARDLGGIVTAFGKVKSARLIRSGELSRLTEQDQNTLKTAGLQRVIDLRTQSEINNSPDVTIQGVEYVNIPVIRATTFGITYEKSDGKRIAEMLQAGFRRMAERGETFSLHMELLYKKFVTDSFSRDAYGKFLKLLTEPVEGATLWHCTAGKDRVGTCTALLLFCLGADREAIFEDYMLTNAQSRESKLAVLDKVKDFVSEEDLYRVDKMLSVDEAFLQGFFDEAERLFGGTRQFLHACGVTEKEEEKLRENYLQ